MPRRCDSFTLREITTAAGMPAYQVSGTIGRERLRRQFGSRNEAIDYQSAQNARLQRTAGSLRTVATSLTEPEVRAAEAAQLRMKEAGSKRTPLDAVIIACVLGDDMPLSQVTDVKPVLDELKRDYPGVALREVLATFRLTRPKGAARQSLHGAIVAYVAELERQYAERAIQTRHLSDNAKELARLEDHFGADYATAVIGTEDLQSYLRSTTNAKYGKVGSFGNKTWNNRRGLLTTFFEFCRRERWITVNPANDLIYYKRVQLGRKPVNILPAERAAELMTWLEDYEGGRLVPYFALAMFGGVRADWRDGEIRKLAVALDGPPDERYARMDKVSLRLGPEVAKKKIPRTIHFEKNLQAWLAAYSLKEYPLVTPDHRQRVEHVRAHWKMKHNVLRHTYCSMMVGKYRSVGETALQAGNSEDILKFRYLELVSSEEAEKFWGIMPKAVAARPLPVPAAGG